MSKLKYLWRTLSFLMVAMLSFGLSSCGDDDDDKVVSNSDLVGFWVKEAHLNNPVRNGSSGTVTSYGFQFLDNENVYVFQLQHTGLGSKYSYAEANTSWEKMTERNGISFFINPDKKLKKYTRAGNQIFVDITSEPTILTITGTDRISAISSDGWAEGSYVRIPKFQGGTDPQPQPEPDSDPELYVINENEILMGVNTLENGWYSYVLQFGFGASGDDAYKNGITQMKLTYWADNGCLDTSYKTYNYGKKKNETLYLSSTKKDWYGWIYVNSQDKIITFNYELEYYNSKDGQWYSFQNRKITFNAGDNQGGGSYTGTVQGHEYVDLGLSVKWATCNVGSSNPESKGWFFQWGETTTSSIPSYCTIDLIWEDYEFYDENAEYENRYKDIGSNISGTKYDAAYKKWGNKWRMATAEEWEELINNCSWKYTTQNSVEGMLGTGKNGQTIFLPAAGRMQGIRSSEGGYYWSASVDPDEISDAQYAIFHSDSYRPQMKEWDRCAAMSIRAVTE